MAGFESLDETTVRQGHAAEVNPRKFHEPFAGMLRIATPPDAARGHAAATGDATGLRVE